MADTGSVSIVIPSIKLEDVVTVAFSDVSHGNMPKAGSQGGEMIFCCEKNGRAQMYQRHWLSGVQSESTEWCAAG